jgi:UDP-glucose 4-epimerase
MSHQILLTGGLGYIGSHTAVALFEAGFEPIIVDNLSNSNVEVLGRLEMLTGVSFPYYSIDVGDEKALNQIFEDHRIQGVIHFAAFKSVSESVTDPLKYFENNLGGLTVLLKSMRKHEVHKLVFSSSCTVYGQPSPGWEVSEESELKEPESPYGRTKSINEQMIRDAAKAFDLQAVILRYFNPVGAHTSALIGELPLGIPANLVPFLTQSVAGLRPPLTVFGNDYPTPDGTCIRDYIHVMDLANAHVAAIRLSVGNTPEIFNIGTGTGSSVMDVVHAFERSTGLSVPYTIGPRRSGDIVAVYANAHKAHQKLLWTPKYNLEDMMLHAWNWQKSLGNLNKH